MSKCKIHKITSENIIKCGSGIHIWISQRTVRFSFSSFAVASEWANRRWKERVAEEPNGATYAISIFAEWDIIIWSIMASVCFMISLNDSSDLLMAFDLCVTCEYVKLQCDHPKLVGIHSIRYGMPFFGSLILINCYGLGNFSFLKMFGRFHIVEPFAYEHADNMLRYFISIHFSYGIGSTHINWSIIIFNLTTRTRCSRRRHRIYIYFGAFSHLFQIQYLCAQTISSADAVHAVKHFSTVSYCIFLRLKFDKFVLQYA